MITFQLLVYMERGEILLATSRNLIVVDFLCFISTTVNATTFEMSRCIKRYPLLTEMKIKGGMKYPQKYHFGIYIYKSFIP